MNNCANTLQAEARGLIGASFGLKPGDPGFDEF